MKKLKVTIDRVDAEADIVLIKPERIPVPNGIEYGMRKFSPGSLQVEATLLFTGEDAKPVLERLKENLMS